MAAEQNAIQINRWDGVAVSRYKDKYSIISVRPSESGLFYSQWARYRTGKDKYMDKDIPIRTALGESKEEAIETLRKLASLVNNDLTFVEVKDLKKPKGGSPF